MTALLPLIIRFGLFYREVRVPLDKKSVFGWLFMMFLLLCQLIPVVFIPGDHKMTLEGNKYGLYMFEANHQCVSRFVISYTNGTTETRYKDSSSARHRCDPYRYWFPMKQMCMRASGDIAVDSISWKFDHSINGEPFYRIVDQKDICTLEYNAFTHNEWISAPEFGAPAVGYPVENEYR